MQFANFSKHKTIRKGPTDCMTRVTWLIRIFILKRAEALVEHKYMPLAQARRGDEDRDNRLSLSVCGLV